MNWRVITLSSALTLFASAGHAQIAFSGQTDYATAERRLQARQLPRRPARVGPDGPALPLEEHLEDLAEGMIRVEARGESELLVQTADDVREPANRRAQITLE